MIYKELPKIPKQLAKIVNLYKFIKVQLWIRHSEILILDGGHLKKKKKRIFNFNDLSTIIIDNILHK